MSVFKKFVAVSLLFHSLVSLAGSYSSWAIDDSQSAGIRLTNALKNLKTKRSVVVAVVDTGIEFNHPLLKDSIVTAPSLTRRASENNYGRDFSKGAKNIYTPSDDHGHGTHIAGIIKSVMPDVKILPLKYYSKEASDADNLKSTVDALRFAIDSGVDIINYSSGGPGASSAELEVLKLAEQKGILVVAAAGNRGSDIDDSKNSYFPASYGLTNIITVINHDRDGKLGPSSNFGRNKADISAPGTEIKSSAPFHKSGVMNLTGTSQSTAFVTGVAAMALAQNPTLDYLAVKDILLKSSRFSSQLREKCLSSGMLDAEKAVLLAQEKLTSMPSKSLASSAK